MKNLTGLKPIRIDPGPNTTSTLEYVRRTVFGKHHIKKNCLSCDRKIIENDHSIQTMTTL